MRTPISTSGPREDATAERWNGRTRGGPWLVTICVRLLPLIRAPGARLGSYLIAAGFMLAGGRAQYGSLAYWRRLRPRAGTLVRLMLVFRHFASFGRILCDRLLAAQRPADYTFSYRNEAALRAAVTSGRGCILLAAHVGNWELSGLRLKQLARGTVHVVMVRGDDPTVQKMADERMRGKGIEVIDPRDSLGASLAIHAALGKGETVCMLGDRLRAGHLPARPVPRGGDHRGADPDLLSGQGRRASLPAGGRRSVAHSARPSRPGASARAAGRGRAVGGAT